MQRQAENFDAIVVGSGISGGWAAKELTERGLRVLLLERGKNIEHQKDYPNARKGFWEYPHRAGRTRAMVDAYPVLQRDYPLNEKNLDWWVNERESPYTEVKRFDWYRGYHVGGRSLTWGRQSYRLSDLDFEANSREGIAVDWPIRYADLAPWYDHVEKHAGIAGSIEKLPQLPDGQFQPAMPLNCAEETIAGRLAKQFGGHRRIIPGRAANLTQPLPGRGRCQYRNACALGCPSGSYFSTQASTLPFAMATGPIDDEDARDRDRRGLRPRSPPRDGRARARRADQRHHRVHLAHRVCVRVDAQLDVAADAFGHRRVAGRPGQQQRRARSQPDGSPLPLWRQWRRSRSSRTATSTAAGRPASTFRASETSLATSANTCAALVTRAARAARGGSARWPSSAWAGRSRMPPPRLDQWTMGATAFGEMLPNHANRISLDAAKTDKWGLPVLAIDCATGENERLMRRDMMNDMAEMLEATGVKQVRVFDNGYYPGMGIHEMGTARMGRDPKTSVLNAHNQVWDCANVFVTDGSCMTSAACQNPSLTYMALTARAAAHAVDELKRGNL